MTATRPARSDIVFGPMVTRLRRNGLARRAVHAARGLRPQVRAARAREHAEAEAALPKLRRVFAGVPDLAARAPRVALVMGQGLVRHVLFQSPLLAGLACAGYRPVVVLPSSDRTIRRLYQAIGIKQFVHFGDHDGRSDPRAATRALTTIHSQRDLLDLTVDGVHVGRFAASTMMRAERLSRIDTSATGMRRLYPYLRRSIDHAAAARRIMSDVKPNAVLVIDKGYTPEGALFDAALTTGADAMTWNSGHRDGTVLLRRYPPEDPTGHPGAISDVTWQQLRELPWSDARWKQLKHEIVSTYESGQWYGEAGTQFNKQAISAEELRHRLGLRDGVPTAVIFPHIFWDATFFWGTDLFADYEHWFVETVRAAVDNPAIDWIVKIHPANTTKNRRDGINDEPSEVTALRNIGVLPDHVHVLQADYPVSTLSVIETCDYCITVRGTVGIEAGCWGKAVLTAGTGRYDGHGFTVDSSSAEEYLDRLAHLQDVSMPDQQQVELARRYAYGLFVVRPLTLESVRASFRQDDAATLEVAFLADSWDAMRRSPELERFVGWLRSESIDFVQQDLLLGNGGGTSNPSGHA